MHQVREKSYQIVARSRFPLNPHVSQMLYLGGNVGAGVFQLRQIKRKLVGDGWYVCEASRDQFE